MTRRQKRVFIARRLPTSVPALIVAVKAIVAAGRKSPHAAAVKPLLDALEAANDALARAQTEADTRAKGKTELRDEALDHLYKRLDAYEAAVLQIAELDLETAASTVAIMGLQVRRPSSRRKPPIRIEPGVSGTLKVWVKAAAKVASYEWEWSANGGKAWNRAPTTNRADTTLPDLPLGVYVLIRYRATTRKGATDWSQPVEVLVK